MIGLNHVMLGGGVKPFSLSFIPFAGEESGSENNRATYFLGKIQRLI